MSDSSGTPSSGDSSAGNTSVPDARGALDRTAGTPERSSHHVVVNVLIPLALLASGVAILFWLDTVEPKVRPDADESRAGRLRALPAVRVTQLASLEELDHRLELEVDGTVVPFQEALVAAEVAGRVVFKSEACEAGSYVSEGQLLMRIDDTDYQLEVSRLERQVEQETQALQELDQEIRNTQRLIGVAEQDVDLQQKEVDRLKALPENFASRAEIDQATRALLASRQQLVTVENQYDLLQQRRARLKASERLAETQLEAAKVNLKRTSITAPIEGVIASEQADVNTFVSRGTTLVTIENTAKVEVSTNLRMDQLQWVLEQGGQQTDEASRGYDLPETPAIIEYEVGGREERVYRWRGRLISYDGIGLDPVTRTVPVRVLVDNPRQNIDASGNPIANKTAPALVRGMYVRVQLLLEPSGSLVVIPAQALQPGNRVLQFIPDDSVIDAKEAEAKTSAASEDAGTAPDGEASEATAIPDDIAFDPKRWQPGRVLVRDSIKPVDSLRVQSGENASELPPDLQPSDRLWVCEAPPGVLDGDSFVVVSPMGDLEDQKEVRVRADRDSIRRVELGPSPSPPPSTIQQSTAAKELASEEAVSGEGV